MVRARVDFLLNKPLVFGVWIHLTSKEIVCIEIKYECLLRFCYNCFHLMHETRNSLKWTRDGIFFGGMNAKFGK